MESGPISGRIAAEDENAIVEIAAVELESRANGFHFF